MVTAIQDLLQKFKPFFRKRERKEDNDATTHNSPEENDKKYLAKKKNYSSLQSLIAICKGKKSKDVFIHIILSSLKCTLFWIDI